MQSDTGRDFGAVSSGSIRIDDHSRPLSNQRLKTGLQQPKHGPIPNEKSDSNPRAIAEFGRSLVERSPLTVNGQRAGARFWMASKLKT